MKKTTLALAALALTAGAAFAQQSPWMVRARAVQLDMANENGTPVAGLGVNNKTIPEVDISYFFSPNLAAELILTVPQKQDVNSAAGKLGTFKHLPPTLTLQYHFTNFQGFKPYVGAGINYTKIMKVDLAGAAAALEANSVTLDNSSTGAAYQVGVDFPIDKHWSFNIDVKKLDLKTHVYVDGVSAGTLKLNPTLFGVGLGYRY